MKKKSWVGTSEGETKWKGNSLIHYIYFCQCSILPKFVLSQNHVWTTLAEFETFLWVDYIFFGIYYLYWLIESNDKVKETEQPHIWLSQDTQCC